MKQESQGVLEGIFPPPLFVLLLTILGSGLQWQKPLAYQSAECRICWLFAGSALIVCAGTLALLARRIMLSRGTPIRFDKPTVAILAQGPFRYTRNPLYLALLLLYTGVGVMANSWWFALLLVALFMFLRRVVVREEAYLERLFGDTYLRYTFTVRRWL